MGRELSIGRLIGHFAATRPDVVALVDDGSADVLTWAELDRATSRLARVYAAGRRTSPTGATS